MSADGNLAKAKEGVENAAETVKGHACEAGHKIGETGERILHSAEEAGTRIKHGAQEAGEYIKQHAENAAQKVGDAFHR